MTVPEQEEYIRRLQKLIVWLAFKLMALENEYLELKAQQTELKALLNRAGVTKIKDCKN
jgi:hypothetical protein